MDKLTIDKYGWLRPNRWISHFPSPNFDDRPSNTCISLLVIHHISLPPNQFGGSDILDFFNNNLSINKHPFYQNIKDLKVSAHLLIKRSGQVFQLVNFNQRAWHAGQSCYQNKKDCNDFSIGIELEGDMKTPYRYGQYQALKQVIMTLKKNYPISDNIVGHEHISPNRKADPGPLFDWHYLNDLIKNE